MLIKKLFKLIIFKIRYRTINSWEVSFNAKIGNNVSVRKGTFIDGKSSIGDFTYIGKNCNITKSAIGRYCSIANNVSIGQGEHDLNMISTSSLFYKNPFEELTKNECEIGNDVWIGVDAIIKRGIKVGNGVVIGANSVVTKDIPDYAIVVGSPAKIIKYRFDSNKIQKIQKTKWWEKDKIEAEKIFKELI